MPSYLVGAKEAFVPTALYHPDFSAIQGLLRTKQMQYNSGFDNFKSAYNSILNAPLTNDQNQVVRDGYLKQVQEQLKDLPETDLSIPKNQYAGLSVFQPFHEDKDIVSDMVKTRQYQQQYQYADQLKQSKDPTMQSKYWDMGVQYLSNGMEDLKTASRGDGSIQAHQSRRYINYVDPQKYLDEEATKEGLKIERESSNGQYKLTRTNGDEAVPLFETWAKGKLGNNSSFNDMFRVQGTVLYENSVKNLVGQGIDPSSAKASLASHYLGQQAANYQNTYDKVKTYVTSLQNQIEKTKIDIVDRPTDDNRNKLRALYDQWKSASATLPQYQQLMDDYSDPNTKSYQDTYNSLVNNGEAFFAEHSRDNFINSWSRARASNSGVKYDIDPGFKLNLELEKEMNRLNQQKQIADDRIDRTIDGVSYDRNGHIIDPNAANNGGISGTLGTQGTGSSAAARKQQALDTPLSIGLNTYGTDPVSKFNRFVSAKTGFMNGYIDAGMNFIQGMSHDYGSTNIKTISGDFLKALSDQMKDPNGAWVSNTKLREEYQDLQKTIPGLKDVEFGMGPMRVYNAIKGYYADIFKDQLKTGTANVDMMVLQDEAEYNEGKYNDLKDIEKKELSTLQKDPKLADVLHNGVFLTPDEYATSKGYDPNHPILDNSGIDIHGNKVKNRLGNINEGYNEQYLKDQWKSKVDQLKREYTDKVDYFKKQFGNTSVGKGDEKYIAPLLDYQAGSKEDQTTAKKLATIALGPQNGTDQNTTTSGIAPANIDQLMQAGGDKDEITNFLQRVGGNAGELISHIQVSKIGINGEPMVKLFFDQAKVDEWSKGKEKIISPSTASSLGKGVEISIKDSNLLTSQGLDLGFIPSSIDMLSITKHGSVKAPQVLRDAGFDYTIEPSYDKKNLLVKFGYKQFKNGNFEPGKYNDTIPINGQSLEEIRRNLFTTALQIYQGNFKASSTYFKQNPQVSYQDVDDLEKSYNYKPIQ